MNRFKLLHTEHGDVTPDQQAQLLAAIREHPGRAGPPFICAAVGAGMMSDRRVDRALQALQRLGLIYYYKGDGWRIVEP